MNFLVWLACVSGWANGIAFVGPLILFGCDAYTVFYAAIEGGDGAGKFGVGDAVGCWQKMQAISAALRQAFGKREQHIRAGALGQTRQQYHGQRGRAEERREFAFALAWLLVGQNADDASGAQAHYRMGLACSAGRGTLKVALDDLDDARRVRPALACDDAANELRAWLMQALADTDLPEAARRGEGACHG